MSQKHNFQFSSKKRTLLEAILHEQGMDEATPQKIPKREEPTSAPMSFSQERLWFLSQLAPESPVYNIPAAIKMTGALNVGALHQSINEVVKRHEILRATFVKGRNGRPVQKIAATLDMKISQIDLQHLPKAEREAEALRLANEEVRRPFELTRGPLIRVTLLRLSEEEFIFLLVMHHIIAEVWSISIFFKELEILYDAKLKGHSPTQLPHPPIQYPDYAEWQRGVLNGEVLEAQVSYWKQQLAGTLPVLQLPYDRSRPATQTLRGAYVSRKLPKRIADALSELSHAHGVTLFMTILSAFKVLLHRYSGELDIIVGSPIAGRNRAETEELIGLFINSLVLRTKLSGNMSFRELLKQVREVCLDAYAHQELPIEKLVEELKPERDTGHTPLFQVMFALQNTPLPSLKLSGMTMSETLGPEQVHNGASKMDVALFVEETEEGLTTAFEYSTDLFDKSTVLRMLEHLEMILTSAAANPEQSISKLPLLTETEQLRLLVEWNDTKTDHGVDKCIHTLFEEQVEKTPDATALVFRDQQISYHELNRRANQLAHHLKTLGVGPDVLVGVCCERDISMIVALLATLKAGGAYVPLDPVYPKDRIAYMIDDSQTSVLITQERLLHQIESNATRVSIDSDWEIIERYSDKNPNNVCTTDNLVYVIYTSGSTGRPKGVAICHRGLLNLVLWHQQTFKVTSGDRATHLAAMAFDASVWELWPYLLAGASVHLAPAEILTSPHQLRDWLLSHDVTISFVPTPMTEHLLFLEWPQDCRLRMLLTGGDKLHRFPSDALPFELINNYGPAENTVVATSGSVSPNKRGDFAPSIGRPISNTQVYLLDRDLNVAPIGVPGELCLGGESLSRGYLHRPELTAEKFIPNPFSNEPGTRLYRTGDLARYLSDGRIEFLGRIDHQVKVRGFRIELGEVEAVLCQHTDVAKAVVLDTEDGYNDDIVRESKRLVAYIVSTHDRALPTDELRRYLMEQLPDYMVPSAFMFLDELPLTPNGKIDRKALPAPEGHRPELTTTYVAPRTKIEQSIAKVCQEVLHIDKVGLHDNFFDLGAHSFLLTEIYSRLRSFLTKDISLIDMFKYPTVSSLARYFSDDGDASAAFQKSKDRAETRKQLMKRRKSTRSSTKPMPNDEFAPIDSRHDAHHDSSKMTPKHGFELSSKKRELLDVLLQKEGLDSSLSQGIPKRKRSGDAPLSFAQERLWFLHQLAPESPVYNIPACVRLTGTLNVAVLEKSLNEIMRRHEVLRTTFTKSDNGPVQIVASNQPLEIAEIDLMELPEDERQTEALRLADEEVQRPFDLEQGPLLRASVIRTAAEEYFFLITMHHIISEVWSITILFRELEVFYKAFATGKLSHSPQKGGEGVLPELPIQYGDFADWQRQWFQGEVVEKQLSYWRTQLGGKLPVLQLPTDYPRPAVQSFHGAWRSHTLPKRLTTNLKNLSQRESTTLFMTCLAAYSALLYRYTGQNDMVVGSPIAGRNRAETEELIGFFVNTLGLRIDLSGDPSFRELVQRVREVALEAYSHQDLPFEKVIEEISPERDTSYSPVFQVMFALQNAPVPVLELHGMTSGQPLGPSQVHNKSAKTDLALFIEEAEDGLIASFEYSTDLFDESTIIRWLSHFETLLESIVNAPDRRISELTILPEAERREIVAQWNKTHSDYPRDKSIQELFEAQVEATPDSIALSYADTKVSYEELNRRANQLAHYLRALGVGPETPVGLCLERSVELIIGVLGILKAGGAYVPLDPSYPKERLNFMLDDIATPVLLTQQSLVASLPEDSADVICLDTEWEAITRESEANPVCRTVAENLAYVVYTSGSTGLPKGTRIVHRSVVRLVKSTNYADFGPDEVFLQLAPVSFDASTFEIWGSLLNGAYLAIFPSHTVSLDELAEVIKANGVTTLWLTAGLFHQMIENHAEGLRPVRQLLAGGDVLSVPHVQTALQQLKQTRLINGYGPTENTTFTCCYSIPAGEQIVGSIPIGWPIANTQIYLLDAWMEPVPIGVIGELYIGGDGLARDYLNRPDLTAERFVPDPFSATPGARLYRTGDLARYRQDGKVEFLGRNDNQVKVRGFRVELGEIEASLGRHPEVRATVVVVREDRPGDKRLVAYVVTGPKRTVNIEELRGFLLERLPDYMIPELFVFLDELPLTPNSKVDRESLPEPDGARPELQEIYIAPRTKAQQTIAAIWKKLLQIEKVGLHDNFFDLGGHSLLMVQANSELRKVFNRDISMIDMFKYPTVSSLAEYLTKEQGESESLQQSKDRAITRKELMLRRKQRTIETSSHGDDSV